ncbi:MAG: SMP-30/gluconolactonase/LRE family protein [Clostridiaceae bacterium]|nr:SMP-30/gluconolactonase/LRE family protein [Clostridiaceae bacterium]
MNHEMLVDAKAVIGEGPVWDEQTQRLFWVDIKGCRIHRYDPASGLDEQIATPRMVGAVALRRDGSLVAALEDGFYRVDFTTAHIEEIWQTDQEAGNRFNDGKCDPDGRFWAGTMSLDGLRPSGALYRLDSDRSVRRLLSGVSISNGLAWSPDKKTVYYIDSPCREIWAFDYHPADTVLANKRTVVRTAGNEGVPDGMTIDSEGRLWVAHWGGSRICVYDPRSGKKLDEIIFPVEQVSSCTFGGKNLNDLYVTTAWNTLSDAARAEQPQAGALYRVRTAAQGFPADRYAG